ncbi:GPW/gp25 family protein [Kitasatospora sp. NPDC056327]|uniref:GPW/gp25 family protein n=1 Tax=Kitasatospora sp. NPDC056327 TaxID=3345785 RepID=UPI0035D5D61E
MDIIGSGWAHPAVISPTGQVVLTGGPTDIEEAIRIILGTVQGERRMRPEFGCGVHELVFDPLDAGTATRAEMEVRQALDRWEPRIEVTDIVFGLDREDPGVLYLDIRYRVGTTNEPRNLVFPFYTLPPVPPGS